MIGATNSVSTANCPRKRGRSLYSIDGWTYGATSFWNFSDAAVVNTRTSHSAALR